MKTCPNRKFGFSLLEVVLVVAIIAILAAIGIPRMSRGSQGAGESALRSDLCILRNAIDLYAAEHGGTFPSVDSIANQLTQYTDSSGNAQADKDTTHYFGPYLRSIPPLPVGSLKGNTKISDLPAADVGWIYSQAAGTIRSNTFPSEKDASGVYYASY